MRRKNSNLVRQILTTESISRQDYEILYAGILKQYLTEVKYSVHINSHVLFNIFIAFKITIFSVKVFLILKFENCL